MRLDVQDGCIDRIAAIHVIEHLYLWDAKKALQEWRRALKVGGRLILELPCMDAVFTHICARFRKDVAPAPTFSWLPIWGDPRHEDPSMMHKWGYFKSDIQAMMVNAGFGDVRFETARYHFPQRDMRITGVK
jgi:ubiquinone/menaquinone biosynthesis C-methylase UbiE